MEAPDPGLLRHQTPLQHAELLHHARRLVLRAPPRRAVSALLGGEALHHGDEHAAHLPPLRLQPPRAPAPAAAHLRGQHSLHSISMSSYSRYIYFKLSCMKKRLLWMWPVAIGCGE